MKKFNKILCLLLALAMMLSLVACGGSSDDSAETTTAPAGTTGNEVVEYVNPYEGIEDYDELSEAIYYDILGEFYEYYMPAFEAETVSERQALMAIAEAKLMEAAVMLPIYTSGGNYAISRLVPYSTSTVGWGYSADRYHTALVCTELLKTADRDTMKAKWAELKVAGEDYLAWAKTYLAEQGYELKNSYTTTYGNELVTWDVLSTSRASEGEYGCLTWMGLYDYNVYNELVPALAESYEKTVNDDGTVTYTFQIREGVNWVDSQGRILGEVTADDWVAGMQHALDSMGGLEYLVQGIIAGVNEYIDGTITDFAEVGVKAVDTYTLEYTLEYDCSFFMTMLGYSIFAPLNRQFYVANGGKFGADYDASAADYLYGTSADHIAYNGPYLVTNVTSESTMVFSKNVEYYDVENVTLDTVTFLWNDGSDVTKSYYDTVAGTIDGAGLSSSTLTICEEDGLFEDYAYVTSTTSTSYMSFYNVNRMATENYNDGAAATTKTEEDLERSYAAMLNVHFRRALAYSSDRASYNAQSVGENLKLARLRNSYTPGTFVSLEEDVTVDINGTATTFEAGTWYGAIMQAQLDADGVDITVWNPEADGGVGSGDGFDGWYNPDNAAAELAIAIEELAAQGVEISAENPIYIDYPYYSGSTTYTNKAQAWKQSIEGALGGCVVINLVECVDSLTWYYTGYYTNYGYESNYEIFDLSGWGPDYGDPQTYLDTFLPDYAGYMIKCIGLY